MIPQMIDQSRLFLSGWKAIAVPGEIHGLWTEYKRFGGAIAWKELLEPTIELMREGYPTSNALAKALDVRYTTIYPYIADKPKLGVCNILRLDNENDSLLLNLPTSKIHLNI